MAAASSMRVSVVIPVFNERRTVLECLRRVRARPEPSEIVIVDDGSSDGSSQILEDFTAGLAAGETPVRLLRLSRNKGKGAALREGFEAAREEIILVQDADLEYDPADYPELLKPILEGEADAVFGSRFMGGRHNAMFFWHTLGNKLLTLLTDMAANINLTDVWTGYKAFRAPVLKSLPLRSDRFGFEPEVTMQLARLGFRICEVPIRYRGRSYAEGKKIGLKDAVAALGTIARNILVAPKPRLPLP